MKVNKLTVFFILTALLFSGFSEGERSDATETTTRIDTDSSEANMLWGNNGDQVEIWIDAIEGVATNDSSQPHPLDIYIATSDEHWDHFCGGEGNMFADEFNPSYELEPLELSELPFYFKFTIPTDDTYYLIIDNCDNQRTTDYKDETGEVSVTYAIDDMGDEAAEGFLAGLGMMACLCIGLPLIIIILLIVVILRRKGGDTQVVVQPAAAEPAVVQQAPPIVEQLPPEPPSS